MPDPISVAGTALLKAASTAASSEPKQDTEKLIARLLGPAIDEFGAALARSVAYRTRNFRRIAEKASVKAIDDGRGGIVHSRVAYSILEDGSLCDDELMAEYLGGVLAGSRSPNGRDDRAITWCRCISGMSWLQARAHFLLYREWAGRLHGRTDLKLGVDRNPATMHVELNEFTSTLITDTDTPAEDALHHAIIGLVDLGLIEDSYAVGDRSNLSVVYKPSPFEHLLIVTPSIRGIELYGWAQGLPGLTIDKFLTMAKVFAADPPIPRLTKVAFTRLPEPPPRQETLVPPA
jgi:hypothetical protein